MGDFTAVLQAGRSVPEGATYLPAEPTTVFWGRLPAAGDAPVLVVAPGTEVVVDTVSHEGILEDQGRDPVAWFAAHGVSREAVLDEAVALAASDHPHDPAVDGPHVVTGPIAVEGAMPGDLVSVTILDTTPRVPYGVISNRHGKGALPGELPAAPGNVSVFTPIEPDASGGWVGALPLVEGGPRVVRFPLAPFLGTIGVAVADEERPHSVPPGAHGGNIDIKLLTEGAVLHLPVQVPGANVYVGDPHFAQGDGEVALTALEASLRVTIRLDLIPREEALRQFGEVLGPMVETDELLVPTGHDRDLDEAMRQCVRAALSLIAARWGMAEHLAYAYLSAATDFRISEVVDIVQGVRAEIRKADFDGVVR
ncbi:acetamidase/formamidase family protein [Agromyces seonyuensis]|uniref:Acetamidase n=1 Tax=Agromyces seonyuensis TaxID=2662446 RepID=A0A6I4NZ79_9MICO|nr:acetamidase/formamidase family protein [Agromyces seonyuensis]MWB97745.1 acetamidase [Agromyces seonyuensis]